MDFTFDFYIESILACGTDIVCRLGSSMEQGPFRLHNRPPGDPAKWARICEHVIRHYNEGWAGGHPYGIRYFEIGNEPDGGGSLPSEISPTCISVPIRAATF